MPGEGLEALKQLFQKTNAVLDSMQQGDNLTESDIDAYMESIAEAQDEKTREWVRKTKQHEKLINRMMLLDDRLLGELPNLPQDMLAESRAKLKELEKKANRSGWDRLKNDFLGREKREAREKLEKLNTMRRALHAALQKTPEEKEALRREARRSVSGGRRWPNPLRAAMNYFTLGPQADRRHTKTFDPVPITRFKGAMEREPGREDDYYAQKETLFATPQGLTIETGSGRLVGAFYRPDRFSEDQRELVEMAQGKLKAALEAGDQMDEEKRKQLRTQLAAANRALGTAPNQGEGKVGPNKRLVILFGGTGGSIAEQGTAITEEYLKAGACVMSVDYRGFGASISRKIDKQSGKEKKIGTHLCEASLYEDGRAIYEYALKLGYKPCNIVLHGFSLGGAVASKLAADLAQENARKENLSKEQRLGGLVLHSSIDSTYRAAKRNTGFRLAGTVGWLGSGGYNTAAHMRRLHKYDAAIPVHYRGGSNQTDQLCLEDTGLHQDPEALFVNATVYKGEQKHQNYELDTRRDTYALNTDGLGEVLNEMPPR